MTLRDKLFGFRGRVRRMDWWWLGILVGIAQIVVMFALASVMSVANLASSATPVTPFEALAALPLYVSLPIQLAFLWPTVALSVQRYHDRDRSAWPLVAYYVVIYGVDFMPGWTTSWLSGLDPSQRNALLIVWGIAVIVPAVWFFIALGILDGTKGPNRFGPSPKGDRGEEAVRTATTFD